MKTVFNKPSKKKQRVEAVLLEEIELSASAERVAATFMKTAAAKTAKRSN